MLPMYDQHLMDVFDILTGADYEVTGSRKVRGRDQNCDRNQEFCQEGAKLNDANRIHKYQRLARRR